MTKTLHILDEQYTAPIIIKTEDSITGYDGDIVVFEFSGISDFDVFTLDDEQEFDVASISEAERIEQLERENALLKAQKQALSEQVDFHEELIVELATQIYA